MQTIYQDRKYLNFEEGIRLAFDKVIAAGFEEMKRQSEARDVREFYLVAEVKGENGQTVKMKIEFIPPTVPTIPSRN